MKTLDLYASIEGYLDFDEEVEYLYKTILEIVIKKKPNTLIDIGCGQGDFCDILNLNGIKTLGTDLSQTQIDIAKNKGIDAICKDIKDIEGNFDCATAVFDVINYIPYDDIENFLKNSYNLINKDGYLIFDINSLYGFEEVAQGTLVVDAEDKFIAIDANFNENVLYTDMTVFDKLNSNYKKSSGTIEQYFYDNEKLTKVLEKVGFVIENIVELNLHSENNNDKYIFICKKDNR